MKILHLALAVGPFAATAFFQSPSAQVKAHVDKLRAAPGISIKLTITPVGGSSTEATLALAKPNLMRLNLPDKELVTDGKTLWTFDRKAQSYTESPVAEGMPNSLLGDDFWAWSAFFDPNFENALGSLRAGKARKMKGFSIKEVEVAFGKRPTASATLLLDDGLGVARGFVFHSTANGATTDTIVFADELDLNYKAAASDFVFVPARGVTKSEAPAVAGLVWKDVEPIFMGNCAGCHGSTASGGVRLTSYEAVMAGKAGNPIVVAGNPAASSILNNLKGTTVLMPPGRKMPDAVVGKIEKWIADGAKKQ